MPDLNIRCKYSEKILRERFRDEQTPKLSCFVCDVENPVHFFRPD